MILTAEIKKELKARGININTFYKRIYRGNTIEQALRPISHGGNPQKLYTVKPVGDKEKHKFYSASQVAHFLTLRTRTVITKNMIIGRLYRNRETVICGYNITSEVVK